MKAIKVQIYGIVLALLAISFSITAYAQEIAGSHETDVEIGFLPGSGIVPPVNPDKPEEETGETGTNQSGPLSLDWVPTLEFGASHTVKGTQQSYSTTTGRPYIQVSDLRGSGSGWKVSAAMSSFTYNQAHTLKGAYLTLSGGSAKSAAIVEPPVPEDPVLLTSDGEIVRVATASGVTKAGMGTWVVRWYPVNGASDVRLTVPAAAATVGTHSTTITWMLYDAP